MRDKARRDEQKKKCVCSDLKMPKKRTIWMCNTTRWEAQFRCASISIPSFPQAMIEEWNKEPRTHTHTDRSNEIHTTNTYRQLSDKVKKKREKKSARWAQSKMSSNNSSFLCIDRTPSMPTMGIGVRVCVSICSVPVRYSLPTPYDLPFLINFLFGIQCALCVFNFCWTTFPNWYFV